MLFYQRIGSIGWSIMFDEASWDFSFKPHVPSWTIKTTIYNVDTIYIIEPPNLLRFLSRLLSCYSPILSASDKNLYTIQSDVLLKLTPMMNIYFFNILFPIHICLLYDIVINNHSIRSRRNRYIIPYSSTSVFSIQRGITYILHTIYIFHQSPLFSFTRRFLLDTKKN
jgi:hypothetical protein